MFPPGPTVLMFEKAAALKIEVRIFSVFRHGAVDELAIQTVAITKSRMRFFSSFCKLPRTYRAALGIFAAR